MILVEQCSTDSTVHASHPEAEGSNLGLSTNFKKNSWFSFKNWRRLGQNPEFLVFEGLSDKLLFDCLNCLKAAFIISNSILYASENTTTAVLGRNSESYTAI